MTTPTPVPMRERLRTDYAWTLRQRQVLELIAQCRSNTEIAEELGLSLAGAKWHVSEILSKLQAEQREEAAEYWRRYNGLSPRFERVFRGIAGGVAAKWMAGAAAVVIAGVVVAVIVAMAINQSDDKPAADEDRSTVTPAPTTPTAAPGEPTVTDPSPTQVSIGPPVASIPNSIMYVVTGCTQCDGPDETLQKHVTDANGNLTSTTLLASNEGVLAGWWIGQVAASPDGATLAVLACDQEYNCGYVGSPPPDTHWRVLLSADQGLTWGQAYAFTGRSGWVSNVIPHGFALTTTVGEGPGATRTFISYYQKALVTLTPPAADVRPVMMRDGSLLWMASEGAVDLLRADGTPMALTPPPRATTINRVSQLASGTLALSWAAETEDGYYTETLQFVLPDGTEQSAIDGNGSQEIEAVTGRLAVGTMNGIRARASDNEVSRYPVLIEVTKGRATAIAADTFTQQGGRNRFIALQSGPFARVATGGDCLNVREQPSIGAASLACYRDGVLLGNFFGDTTEADDVTWLKVATPDGREGWASAEFLVR